jgi:hypothetical protein
MAILRVLCEVRTDFSNTILIKFRNCILSNRIRILCGPRQLSRYNDLIRTGRSGERIPVGGEFFRPLQTGPGAPPPSLLCNGYRVTSGGKGVNHPPPSSAEVKERVELYLYSPSGPSWWVIEWHLPLSEYY